MKAHYLLRGNKLVDELWAAKARSEQQAWSKRGRLGPPHGVKQRMILDHAEQYGIDVFVETGTFLGDMVYAMRNSFKSIYSIELSPELHQRALASFKQYPHIHLIAGDSGTALPALMQKLDRRCLFWLDGHYSGGVTAKADAWTPVIAELEAISDHRIKDHVMLIDDAVCFNGYNGYPTLFALQQMIAEQFPNHRMQVFDNVIQAVPA